MTYRRAPARETKVDLLDLGQKAYAAGDLGRAERLFRRAVAHGFHDLGVIAVEREAWAAAERRFREALAADPEHAEAGYALALELLAQGRYGEGWALHEHRKRLARLNLVAPPRGVPEWRGEDLRGKRVIVLAEQGFGDQIMFARFVKPLEALGAMASVFCPPELGRLIPRASSAMAAKAYAAFDYWIYSGSLPLRLGVTLQTLPPPLALPKGFGGKGVGVLTRGRATFAHDAHRSLDPESAAALLALGRDLHVEATGARDFAETAEIVGGLDLVITADTAVAHLAASMGKPTWILLPRRFTDWRWLRDRTDSPWYPTARLFRQTTRGDWRSVIVAVKAELG